MGAYVACGQSGGRVVGVQIKEVVGDELMQNVVGEGEDVEFYSDFTASLQYYDMM